MRNKAENYEYRMPEGYVWTNETRLKFDGLVDELQLTEVQAQRLLDLHIEMMEEYADAYAESKLS